jgi:acyl dehydratase
MADQPYHRTLSDFRVGRVFEHLLHKTIESGDHNLFCLLTLNHNPIHIDEAYAAKTQHGQILVAGTYVFSLAVGMSVPDISGACIANLEYEHIVHHAPVFFGDTIRAATTVLAIEPSRSKTDRGVLTVETSVFNQDNVKVLSFRRKVLLPRK